jgi:hypothetical protein
LLLVIHRLKRLAEKSATQLIVFFKLIYGLSSSSYEKERIGVISLASIISFQMFLSFHFWVVAAISISTMPICHHDAPAGAKNHHVADDSNPLQSGHSKRIMVKG